MMHPYATASYVASLAHVGEALPVPEWGTGILARPIIDGLRDGLGTYPITVFGRDADLSGGIERLRRAGLVSVTLVVADTLRPPMESLERAFPIARRFKTHYLHDRDVSDAKLSKHHRYELKRALERVSAGEFELASRLEEWCDLYDGLAHRHGLKGVHAFPRAHHVALSGLPGIRAFGAFLDDRLVSCHIWACHAGHAMSHLAASDEAGYALGAAYAVNHAAVTNLSDCRVLNFGGGAGSTEAEADGLVRFKKGFSNATAPAYLLGAVLDEAAYASLRDRLAPGSDDDQYFPAYRRTQARKAAVS